VARKNSVPLTFVAFETCRFWTSGVPGEPRTPSVVVVTLKDLDQAERLSLQKAGVTAVLRKGPGTAAMAANLLARSLAPEEVAV